MTLREAIEQSGQTIEEVLEAKLGEQDRERGIFVMASMGFGPDEPPVEITIILSPRR